MLRSDQNPYWVFVRLCPPGNLSKIAHTPTLPRTPQNLDLLRCFFFPVRAGRECRRSSSRGADQVALCDRAQSSFAYKGNSPDIRQVGRELGVRYVLEGSVRRVGNRVRITSQLVDAQTGVHLWAERFDRSLDDIFALQDEITLNVIGAIEPSLRQTEIKPVERKRPSDLNAYDLVLRHPARSQRDAFGASRGLTLLGQALAREPDYAAAHGYAAWCHEILFLRGGFREENRIAAIRHAHNALVHGRDDATALALGGFVIGLLEHDHATASDAFETALSLRLVISILVSSRQHHRGLGRGCGACYRMGRARAAIKPLRPVKLSRLRQRSRGTVSA